MRIMEPVCSKLLLHKEERQQTTTSTRLLTTQQMDHQEPECITPNPLNNRPT